MTFLLRVRAIAIAILCTIIFSFSSCNHKELCYHHEHLITIRVQFDWRYSPDAEPRGMSVFFYPEDAGKAIRYDFNNKEGGQVSLPTGRYRILAYNNDCEITEFDITDSFTGHRAFTRQGNPLEPVTGPGSPASYNGETVVCCPDEIWCCSAIDVDITQDGISYICVPLDQANEYIGKPIETTEQVITLYPQDILCRYTYEVRNVAGLERISQICGCLSGMSPSVTLSTQDLHALPVTLPFEATINANKKTITGGFLTFGHHEDNLDPHRMNFFLWMKNGKQYIVGKTEEKYDVTVQVHAAPDRRRVHIIIDGMKIPEGESPNQPSDISPSTDDWFEFNTDINI